MSETGELSHDADTAAKFIAADEFDGSRTGYVFCKNGCTPELGEPGVQALFALDWWKMQTTSISRGIAFYG